MSNPRDHHFVPQCYLREFGKEKKLVCLNLLLTLKGIDVRFSYKEPRQICYIKDYYKIIKTNYFDLNIYHENYIELNAFSKLENQYRKVIQSLITKQEVDFEGGLIICDFILNLKLRNPSFNNFIDHHKERNNEIAKKQLVNKLMKDYRFNHFSYSFLKILVDSFGENVLNDANFNKILQLQQIIDKTDPNSSNILKFRKEILDCQWFLLDSENCDLSFITSDNPGISVTKEGILENMKFKNGFKYFFPINEKFCLYFSDEEQDEYYSKNKNVNKQIKTRKITNQELNLFNIYQICYHNKYAISTNEKNLEYIKKELLK